ncbi:MAG: PDZ domain-containing protein [Ruminiclostridium sp.]|nr:PDZ domain-containing protein [Ruminiclostridium sp.]
MNKKVSLGVAISLVAVACAITFVLTMTVSLNMYNSMVTGVQERETINAKIKEIDTFVRGSSIYDMDETDVLNGIMDGYISGLEDKYARYYTTSEYYKKQQRDSGEIIGIGVETVIEGDYLKVTEVYENSAAEVAEIRKDYVITKVNNRDILNIGAQQAQKQLEGEEGTKVTITTKAPDGTENTVTLVRQVIELQSVKGAMVEGYAYIKISTFNALTDDQFTRLIDKYESQSVLGYIFDLRNVSEGDIAPLQNILSRIMPKATVAKKVLSDGSEEEILITDGSGEIKKPMAVIVNNTTACAAELFAVALRDFSGAAIVGSVTAGKAELQTVRSFKDGSAVSISTALVYPLNSESFHNSGLKPGYIIDITQQQEMAIKFADPTTDPQLQKAVEAVASL